MPAAARPTDPVQHPLPPVLTPGPGCPTVLIGYLPAWRGVGAAAAAALTAANKTATTSIQVAESATKAAAGTPGAPAALAAEQALKTSLLASMSSMVTSMAAGADIHMCVTPTPVPPHGPGVVTTPSKSVTIGGLPAARQGDTIIEAIGPPNKIVMGFPTVDIGD